MLTGGCEEVDSPSIVEPISDENSGVFVANAGPNPGLFCFVCWTVCVNYRRNEYNPCVAPGCLSGCLSVHHFDPGGNIS